MKTILTSMIIALSLSSPWAQADPHEGHHGMGNGPCHADVENHCKDVEPGEGRIMKCMKENEDKLSAECKAQKEKMKEHMHDIKEVCKADFEKFCGDVKPGHGRWKKCLRKHKDELSDSCKKEVKEMREDRKKGRGK